MAISNYLQTCEYKLGGLKPFIYVIHKNALKLNIKAKGIEVNFNKTKESDVYKIEAQMVVYEQQETYANKFRFDSSVKVTINEQYREPFFYGLRTLRTNQYYIIIEDKKGVQYLVNPELYTKMTYEYTITDTIDNHNSVEITWNNLSNFPLLIFKERVESNLLFLGEECFYTIGNAYNLVMTRFQDLHAKDDGVKAEEIYVDDIEKLKEVQYLKESFTLTETYDGNKFTTELTFSIPLSDHQFEWAYDLLEFNDNTYKGLVRTTNDNYLLLGNENGLFPSYTIRTSEDDGTLNTIEFKFTNISQYPILYTDEIKQYKWIPDGELCFGFDKYQMLKQQYSKDWGQTWVDTDPIVKKKGDVIASNSEECKEYRWVDDELYCAETGTTYVKWLEAEGQFLCENGNKYAKLRKCESNDGITYTLKEEYAKGRMIESNSTDCTYVAVRWTDGGIRCYDVDESKTYTVDTGDTYCKGTSLYTKYVEMVTHNGEDYFEYDGGDERILEENCCDCGYYYLQFDATDEYACGSELSDILYITNYNNGVISDAYINTNIPITDDLYYRIKYRVRYGSGGIFIGDIDSPSDNNDYRLFFLSSYGYLDMESRRLSATTFGGTSNTYEMEIGTTYVKNLSTNSITGSTSYTIADRNRPLYIYAPSNHDCDGVDIYYFQIYNSRGLIRDFIPYKQNGVVGLYDKVERKFYSSNGNGQFVAAYSNDYVITTQYRKYIENKYCGGNLIEPTGVEKWVVYDETSCDCIEGQKEWRFNDEYVCGEDVGQKIGMKYEVWREWKICELDGSETETGNIEYRNPQKSSDCKVGLYQWREENSDVCGSALPSNTTEVSEAPDLNVDFEE